MARRNLNPIPMKAVTVDLTQDEFDYPNGGDVQISGRFIMKDKLDIDHAAQYLGMKQVEFQRIILVRAARIIRAHFEQKPEKKKKKVVVADPGSQENPSTGAIEPAGPVPEKSSQRAEYGHSDPWNGDSMEADDHE